MPHLPGHKYIGPGTSDFKPKPIDSDDAIARQHDLAYVQAGDNKDIFKADRTGRDEFFSDYIHNNNYHSLLGGLGLGAKNLLEEHVLGKPIYGMPPIKKNWAAIRRINQNRANRREAANRGELRARGDIRGHGHQPNRDIEPDAEVNADELPEFLQAAFRDDAFPEANEAGPSGTQPNQEAQIEPPPKKSKTDNMENTLEDYEMVGASPGSSGEAGGVDLRTGGPQPATGGAGGASGGGLHDIFSGAPQINNKATFKYSKSYHFTLSNGLPQWRNVVHTANEGRSCQLRLNNVHGIPWERLAMYMSEGEMLKIIRCHTMVKVNKVKCEVYSLGVRLPFVTSATTSTVANANAQYPIGCFHFDNDYQTRYLSDETNVGVADIINKALGAEWKTDFTGNTTAWTDQFPNISASTTSRDINNPVIVEYPLQYVPNHWAKDVGIYDYVDIKNGTTAYGKCWEKTFIPTNGILAVDSTLMGSDDATPAPVVIPAQSFVATPIPGLENGYFMNQNEITQESIITREKPKAYTANKKNYNTSNSINNIMVDYEGYHAFGDRKCAPVSMPKFMIGFVNIRNEDNSLLQAKWDILIRCHIELSVVEAERNFVTRIPRPVPFYFNTPYQQFQSSTGNSVLATGSTILGTVPSGRRRIGWPINVTTTDPDESLIEEIRVQENLRHKSSTLKKLKNELNIRRSSRNKKLEKAVKNINI